MPGPRSPQDGSRSDPYRGVVFVLLAAAVLGTAGAIAAGLLLPNRVLLDVAVTLGVSSGVLIGVAMAQAARVKPPKGDEDTTILALVEGTETPASTTASGDGEDSELRSELKNLSTHVSGWLRDLRPLGVARIVTAVAGVVASAVVLWAMLPATEPAVLLFAIAASVCLVGTGLALTAAHYLKNIEPARFPEAAGLCCGARVVAWILALGALSIGLAWEGQQTIVRVSDFVVLAVNLSLCYALFAVKQPEGKAVKAFPLDLGVLSVLGSRTNVLGSILDTAEQQLGIDLRSTWALTVVRQGLEPLVMGLLLVGWLSTSLTVVGLQEQGLVERLGVPVEGQPLQPGLHVHWPWPVDQVFRIPVLRIQSLQVGHEGEEGGGPENVLWAVEHAPNE